MNGFLFPYRNFYSIVESNPGFFRCALLRHVIGRGISSNRFNQSDSNIKLILSQSLTFSRLSGGRLVFTLVLNSYANDTVD